MQCLKNYRLIDLPLNLVVLVIYFCIAKLGLAFAIIESSVTIFWPAGGFALAILLLAGPIYLPGAFLGAFAVNLSISDAPLFSLLAATGNTLETICAYWLLTKFRPIHLSLGRLSDLFKLLFYGAMISTLLSAFIGPISLVILENIPFERLPSIILHWWMGNAIGIAFITPLILFWYQSRQLPENDTYLELFALYFLTITMGQVVLFHWLNPLTQADPSIAWLLPFIIWSGLRAGQRHTSLIILIIFLQALWSASQGVGHYANAMQDGGLVNFWLFGIMIIIGGTVLTVISAENKKRQHKAVRQK
jgi:integral membrane sensor domain MASE1